MEKTNIPINAKVMSNMYQYAEYAKEHFGTEIAGWGHYSSENGIYKLAPLMEQEVSGAEVESFPDEILNDVNYDISNMIVQWHSHVDMSCTPSATDKKMIEDALELMPMIISIIVNCKNEYTATIAFKKAGIFQFDKIVKLDVNLCLYYNNSKISNEVKLKLREKKEIPVEFKPRYNDYYGQPYKDLYNEGIVPFNSIGEPFLPIDTEKNSAAIHNIKDKKPTYFEKVREKAHLLCEDYDSLSIVDYGEHIYIANIDEDGSKSMIVDISAEDGILINEESTTWANVLEKLGLPVKDQYKYKLS